MERGGAGWYAFWGESAWREDGVESTLVDSTLVDSTEGNRIFPLAILSSYSKSAFGKTKSSARTDL
jgi:hypothetical protein